MNYSPHYNLKEPSDPDYYNVEEFNYNTEIIDKEMFRLSSGGEVIEHTVLVPEDSWVIDGNDIMSIVLVPDVTPDSIVLMGIPMGLSPDEVAPMYSTYIYQLGTGTIILKRSTSYSPGIDVHFSFLIYGRTQTDNETSNS